MKKKFLILLIVTFLLCGCKANYTIEIDENSVEEETYIYSDDSDEYNNETYRGTKLIKWFPSLVDFKQSSFINTTGEDFGSPSEKDSNDYGLGTYDIKYINKSGEKGTKFMYTFNKTDYENAYAPNTNLRSFEVDSDDEEISIVAKDIYAFTSYKMLDEVKVLVKVSDYYEVTSNNAQIVNGNEYMWVITRENYLNNTMRINLKVKSDDADTGNNDSDGNDTSDPSSIENKKETKETNYTKILIYVLLGALVLVGAFLILFQKKANNNRI